MRCFMLASAILAIGSSTALAQGLAPQSLPIQRQYPYSVSLPAPPTIQRPGRVGRGTYGMTPGADAMSQLGGGYGGYGQYGGYGLTRHEINLIRFQAYETAIQLDRQQWIHRDLTPRWGGVGGIPRWYNGR